MKTINDYKVTQNSDGSWQVIGIIGLREEFLFNFSTEPGITAQKLRERTELELRIRDYAIDERNVAVEFNEDMDSIRKLMRSALRTLDGDAGEATKKLPIIQSECLVSQTIMKTYSLEIQRKQVGIKAKGIKNA